MSEKSGPTQQTFDWSNDSAECVEGLKFDLGVPYAFTLDNFTKHNLVRKNGEVVCYKTGDREGQPIMMYTAHWKMVDVNVTFKLDFFVQDKYRVNENAPETEDEFVKFSRKLGYNPVLNGKFSPSDFIHLGMKISAELKEQAQSDSDKAAGKKAYNTIDIDTILLDGESSTDSQQEIKEEITEEVVKEINAIINTAPKCKKFNELTARISKLGAKDKSKFDLLEPAMTLNSQGRLKF